MIIRKFAILVACVTLIPTSHGDEFGVSKIDPAKVLGWTEKCTFESLGMESTLRGRVDTGGAYNAIGVYDLEIDGDKIPLHEVHHRRSQWKQYVGKTAVFRVHKDNTGKLFQAEVTDLVPVKDKPGRFVIDARVTVKGIGMAIPFTLANRSRSNYPMLIGRPILSRGEFLVGKLTKKNRVILGRSIRVRIGPTLHSFSNEGELQILEAGFDSGARICSLGVADGQLFVSGAEVDMKAVDADSQIVKENIARGATASFRIHGKTQGEKWSAKVVDCLDLKRGADRYVVEIYAELDGVAIGKVEASLTDRTNYSKPMNVGRTAIQKANVLINVP